MELAQRIISSRRGSLYASLVAAVLAGIVILAYVNGYRKNLQATSTPVTVLVARHTIEKGTAGTVIATKGLFTVTTIRESQLREGAFSDPASLSGKVATTPIYKGAQLTATDFSASSDSLASTLSDRQRIIAVPLDGAHGLSGEVQEGDHVDVYAGFNIIGVGPNGAPTDGGQARPVMRLIVQDVQVVRLGSSAASARPRGPATSASASPTRMRRRSPSRRTTASSGCRCGRRPARSLRQAVSSARRRCCSESGR